MSYCIITFHYSLYITVMKNRCCDIIYVSMMYIGKYKHRHELAIYNLNNAAQVQLLRCVNRINGTNHVFSSNLSRHETCSFWTPTITRKTLKRKSQFSQRKFFPQFSSNENLCVENSIEKFYSLISNFPNTWSTVAYQILKLRSECHNYFNVIQNKFVCSHNLFLHRSLNFSDISISISAIDVCTTRLWNV